MSAKSKTELLDVTDKEYEKLLKLIVAVSDDIALLKDDEDTSIKDVIAHRGHWIDLFLGWHADGLAGKPVFFPADGYKWNDLKRYNADLRARQTGMTWTEAKNALQASHDALVRLLQNSSNDVLYGGPMKGANNKWTTGRWAEAAGPSHFRSASKYLRARLKALS